MNRAGVTPVVLAALAIGGCSLLTNFDDGKLSEDTFERCRDRTDNNNDGLVDCDDPGCAPFDICTELTPDSCADGIDNDKDGFTDCADPGCSALPGVCVEQTPEACTDGKDNDNDGAVDCNDSDCRALDVCRELSGPECVDGQDNDRDGLVDCNDFDCYLQPACCTIDFPVFVGDDFSHQSDCSIHACTDDDPTCCKSGYQQCNPFDPTRWVVWGLPRPIQDQGAFVSNEPCGCGESSGIVSVESVALRKGTSLDFDLTVKDHSSTICGGLTVSNTFVDDLDQCSGTPQPQLLLGACLEAAKDGDPRLVAVVDGAAKRHTVLSGGGPVRVTIALLQDGVSISGGSLSYLAPSPMSAISSALVLIHGSGTAGRLERLTITGSRETKTRCRAPGDWYRHLARGAPVLGTGSDTDLLRASDPTVIYQPELKAYTMLFVGRRESVDWEGIYMATSTDGTRWKVSDKPVIPADAKDTAFGRRQDSPTLLYRDGRYHLWYTREDESGSSVQRAIAHATSADGKKWRPETGALGQLYVLEPGKALAWDSLEVYSPTVVAAPDGALLMWYTGTRADPGALPAIGVARSMDGSLWARIQQQPVVAPEPGSAELACEDPAVVYDDVSKTYLMWYTYRAFGQHPAIRHAVSPNGLAWSPWPTPVYASGALGTFDERGVVAPALLLEPPLLRLWYAGVTSTGVPQIGYAENRGQQ